jgi:hypothetical protein
MDSLRFPIRFEKNGEISRLADGSDEFYAQLLALTAQIQPGELPLTPTFGVSDPTFEESLTRQLSLNAAAQIPEVFVQTSQVRVSETGKTELDIQFGVRK